MVTRIRPNRAVEHVALAVIGALLILAIVPARVRAAEVPAKERIAALVERARKAWRVPGVAVVIVHDDRIAYLAGHGTTRLDGKDAVTPGTMFPLASCSKAFTTTALAMLVERGKLDWDDRARKHVPFFRLADPLADGQVTLRDLVTHRTGVASHDFLWYNAPWSPEESVRRIAHVKPSALIRTRFAYQSVMFTAAGLAVGSAAGKPWEAFVRDELFSPLKMTTACCTSTEAEKINDRATGHRLDARERIVAFEHLYKTKLPNAAGSVHASARDLVGWLRLHVNGGVVDGTRLVAEKHLAETHAAQMVLPLRGDSALLHPDTHLMSYGMGWVLQDYQGRKLISHGGIIDGFKVQVTIVPELKLGFAILHATRMNLALGYSLVDEYLGIEARRDWNAYLKRRVESGHQAEMEKLRKRIAERHVGTKPSREPAAYAGNYEHPGYGSSRITLQRGRLTWRWGKLTCELEHFHFNTFVMSHEKTGRVELQFHLDDKGRVARYEIGAPFGVEFTANRDR